MSLLLSLLERVKGEPAIVVGVVVAVVVQVAASLNVVIDEAGLKEAIEPLVVALVTRQLVVPASKIRKEQELPAEESFEGAPTP